jgi:hypothetical protein
MPVERAPVASPSVSELPIAAPAKTVPEPKGCAG